MPFDQTRLGFLKNVKYEGAGAIGTPPSFWAKRMKIDASALPDHQLSREEVLAICQDGHQDPIVGYICVMAWGGQDRGPSGRRNAQVAWQNINTISERLNYLKNANPDRGLAYDLFSGNNGIPGLGPAYFTKLLYFFSKGRNHYIMDQWTAKSVNLLTSENIVVLDGHWVSRRNTARHYESFCNTIDLLGRELNHVNHQNLQSDQVEELLMSKGGRRPWPWRAYVKEYWP